ncbi:MAG: (d)CMP kinase [Gordonia sp. (in: high G+C Gram-positive bacteria)]
MSTDPPITGVIAIDGPAATGKSTLSKLLADKVGARYLDTGAMYRAVTLAVLGAGVALDDATAIARVVGDANVELRRGAGGGSQVLLDGADVTGAIRTEAVTAAVSAVSAIPAVRTKLVALQQHQAQRDLLVVEGRDIGTVVFPDALVKVFLTASPQVRAERRHRQNLDAGRPSDYDEVLASVNRRDHLDSTRAVSPLRPAQDATLVDTSDMTREQVLDRLVGLTREIIGGAA